MLDDFRRAVLVSNHEQKVPDDACRAPTSEICTRRVGYGTTLQHTLASITGTVAAMVICPALVLVSANSYPDKFGFFLVI